MRRLLIILPVLFFFGVFACKKTKGPVNGNSVQKNNNLDSTVSVSAVINGAEWITDSAYGYTVKHSGNDSGITDLLITATATDKKSGVTSTIVFNISNYSGKGEYVIDPPFNTASFYVGNFRHYALQGSFTVISDTAYALRGQFAFTADTIQVKEGKFDVALP